MLTAETFITSVSGKFFKFSFRIHGEFKEFDPAILRARLFAHVRAVKREMRLPFFLKKNHGAINSGKPRKTGVSICFEAMHFRACFMQRLCSVVL